MPKNQIDYSQVCIYKICCKDISINDIYVGHTTNFEQRKNSHKRSCETLNKNIRLYNFIHLIILYLFDIIFYNFILS